MTIINPIETRLSLFLDTFSSQVKKKNSILLTNERIEKIASYFFATQLEFETLNSSLQTRLLTTILADSSDSSYEEFIKPKINLEFTRQLIIRGQFQFLEKIIETGTGTLSSESYQFIIAEMKSNEAFRNYICATEKAIWIMITKCLESGHPDFIQTLLQTQPQFDLKLTQSLKIYFKYYNTSSDECLNFFKVFFNKLSDQVKEDFFKPNHEYGTIFHEIFFNSEGFTHSNIKLLFEICPKQVKEDLFENELFRVRLLSLCMKLPVPDTLSVVLDHWPEDQNNEIKSDIFKAMNAARQENLLNQEMIAFLVEWFPQEMTAFFMTMPTTHLSQIWHDQISLQQRWDFLNILTTEMITDTANNPETELMLLGDLLLFSIYPEKRDLFLNKFFNNSQKYPLEWLLKDSYIAHFLITNRRELLTNQLEEEGGLHMFSPKVKINLLPLLEFQAAIAAIKAVQTGYRHNYHRDLSDKIVKIVGEFHGDQVSHEQLIEAWTMLNPDFFFDHFSCNPQNKNWELLTGASSFLQRYNQRNNTTFFSNSSFLCLFYLFPEHFIDTLPLDRCLKNLYTLEEFLKTSSPIEQTELYLKEKLQSVCDDPIELEIVIDLIKDLHFPHQTKIYQTVLKHEELYKS